MKLQDLSVEMAETLLKHKREHHECDIIEDMYGLWLWYSLWLRKKWDAIIDTDPKYEGFQYDDTYTRTIEYTKIHPCGTKEYLDIDMVTGESFDERKAFGVKPIQK